jgi:CCR4-NOT transcriptional complex subunit CAF120
VYPRSCANSSCAVLSFMSQWGGGAHLQKQPPSNTASPAPASPTKQPSTNTWAQSATALDNYNSGRNSPAPGHQRARSDSRPSSRPMSMIQTYQPPVMDIGADTLPELHRIFTFLNSHSNKLYQEGYFLKFHDTDTRTSSAKRTRSVTLTACRWPSRARQEMARVLCPARRHNSLALGC